MPGTVSFKLDRRMIPEENPTEVETDIRRVILDAAAACPGVDVDVDVDIQHLLLARALHPQPGDALLAELTHAIQTHASALLDQPIPAVGTPSYTDARVYAEAGIPGVIYGAGPRTVLESNAKRADEHLQLRDLRCATQVLARVLKDLLT